MSSTFKTAGQQAYISSVKRIGAPEGHAQPFRLPASFMDLPFGVTRRGQEELDRGKTRLSWSELELLVRIDGKLTLAQVRGLMGAADQSVFMTTFQRLHELRLVAVVENDPMELRLQANLNAFALLTGEKQEEASLRSLSETGFFVDIARERVKMFPPAANQTLSVVVVEDDPLLARFIQTFLTLDGFAVRPAANRAEVVAELNRWPIPDLILLDVVLPDVNGFDILQRVRAHAQLKDTPVLMLTGAATRADVLRGIECGADGYVTKPFQADSFMRAVRTVLGLPGKDDADPDVWQNTVPGL